MIRFVVSFIVLLISSFVFIWSMYEFVEGRNQIFLLAIALGSMGIFFSCFSVFSFLKQKQFPGETTEGFSETSSLWGLSALVFSLALIIGVTLIIFDRNHKTNPQEVVKIENQSSSPGVANNQTGKEIASLGGINHNPPNAIKENEKDASQTLPSIQAQVETPKNYITTSVSSQKQNTRTQPIKKALSKRQYLSDGTPIPYDGERIFMKY